MKILYFFIILRYSITRYLACDLLALGSNLKRIGGIIFSTILANIDRKVVYLVFDKNQAKINLTNTIFNKITSYFNAFVQN